MQIGRLTADMETHERIRTDLCNTDETQTKEKQLAAIGLARQQANRFETLAKHPEVVEQAN